MEKVSVSQTRDRGFEPLTGSHQNWLIPGNGLESDLNKLRELASQSSKNRTNINKFKLRLLHHNSSSYEQDTTACVN